MAIIHRIPWISRVELNTRYTSDSPKRLSDLPALCRRPAQRFFSLSIRAADEIIGVIANGNNDSGRIKHVCASDTLRRGRARRRRRKKSKYQSIADPAKTFDTKQRQNETSDFPFALIPFKRDILFVHFFFFLYFPTVSGKLCKLDIGFAVWEHRYNKISPFVLPRDRQGSTSWMI